MFEKTVNIPVPFLVAILVIGLLWAGLYFFSPWGKGDIKALLQKIPALHGRPFINAIMWFSVCLSPFWLVLAVFTLFGVFELWYYKPNIDDQGVTDGTLRLHYLALAGLTTILAGLISAPLALLRIQTIERQTTAQEEGLITDRINAAVEGLGSEKIRKKSATNADGVTRDIEESVPNLEVRIGAIYALDRIAKKNLDDHIQIMKILCAYIRENAPASSAPALPEPPDWFEGKNEDEYEKTWQALIAKWKDDHSTQLANYKPRIDIQTAITVIGRRTKEQKAREWGKTNWNHVPQFDQMVGRAPEFPVESKSDRDALNKWQTAFEKWERDLVEWEECQPSYRLDLRNSNLVGLDMSGAAQPADFSYARFEGAQLQGADFIRAQVQRADFTRAQAQGASFLWAQAQGAEFTRAQAQGANFYEAEVQGAKFEEAQAQRANFTRAQAQRASFLGAQAQGTRFISAQAQGASFFYTKAQEAGVSGAKFLLSWLKGADYTQTSLSAGQVNSAFGDVSTQLPDRALNSGRPTHWPQWDIDLWDQKREWEKWKKNPDNYTPPPKPDDKSDN